MGQTSVLLELKAETAEQFGLSKSSGESDRMAMGRDIAGALPLNIDTNFAPVLMQDRGAATAMAPSTGKESDTVIVRAFVDDIENTDELSARPEVAGVFADPEIAPFPIDCASSTSTGNRDDLERLLGTQEIWGQLGHRGENVVIGILDGGVDANQYNVGGGWSPDPNEPSGSANVVWDEHGNMCAYDALVASRDATIYDYSIGRGIPGTPLPTVAAALQAFDRATTEYVATQVPMVLSNSWGLWQDQHDPFPAGHRGNYTHNPRHPFTRAVVAAIDAGILVTFAAGNCGGDCPASPYCGADVGPNNSIRGANGHREVICVGAVNLRGERIGYSSEGFSTLDSENPKPDICSYSHFEGHFNVDNGTSAACPVVAGVLGLMAAKRPGVRQRDAMQSLTSTASQLPSYRTPNNKTGYGIVDALSAHNSV